ncbi:MAG: undecaprenyl-diphosphate phosphatase [Planctomycetota bacterium]|jgi:undecaprenyl-diphosphatase|nr:undecaprenyl-diphosphate phosphatase [Planctomycetota bacterium]
MSPFSLLLLLAVIQGLSEFLPISSSGHLAIAENFLPGGSELPTGVEVEILLHLGTLGAVLIHYRQRIARLLSGLTKTGEEGFEQRHYLLKLIIASVPAAFVGLFVFDTDSEFFNSMTLAASGLLFTSIILLSSKMATGEQEQIGYLSAILIGCAQAIAVIPGVSRSGSTIIAARHLKIAPQSAENFSFLMAIPTIGGAAILKLPQLDLSNGLNIGSTEIASVLILSCVVGLIALRFLHQVLHKQKLYYFAPYCGALALIVLAAA